jgi:hypothetical protein
MYNTLKNVREMERSDSTRSIVFSATSNITVRDIAGIVAGAFLAYLMSGI